MPRRDALQAEWVRWTLRLPKDVNDALEVIARANRRSVNNQVVVILEEWLARQGA